MPERRVARSADWCPCCRLSNPAVEGNSEILRTFTTFAQSPALHHVTVRSQLLMSPTRFGLYGLSTRGRILRQHGLQVPASPRALPITCGTTENRTSSPVRFTASSTAHYDFTTSLSMKYSYDQHVSHVNTSHSGDRHQLGMCARTFRRVWLSRRTRRQSVQLC